MEGTEGTEKQIHRIKLKTCQTKVWRSQTLPEGTEGTEKEKRRIRSEGTEEGCKRRRHAGLKCGVPGRTQRAQRVRWERQFLSWQLF